MRAKRSRRELGASGTISNRGARVEVRGEDSQARVSERVDQRVQVMDGGRATILTGQSRPVRQRQFIQTPSGVVSQEVTVVQEATSGFEVVPRVSGRTATVEIFASRAGLDDRFVGRFGTARRMVRARRDRGRRGA